MVRRPFANTTTRTDINQDKGPSQHQQLLVLTKGAPEAVAPLLASVPPNFAATYLYHMGRGRRVLALAYRCVAGCFSVWVSVHVFRSR